MFCFDFIRYELVYGTAPSMDKKTRLEFKDSCMTHAMLFTGYRTLLSGTIPPPHHLLPPYYRTMYCPHTIASPTAPHTIAISNCTILCI